MLKLYKKIDFKSNPFFIKLIFPLIFLFISTIYIFFQNGEATFSISENREDSIFSGKFSIKSISIEELDSIPKISKKDAINIFKSQKNINSWNDFKKIKGISDKKIEILKTKVILH